MDKSQSDQWLRGLPALFMIISSLIPQMSVAQSQNISVDISGIDVRRGGNLIVLVFAREGFPVKHEQALLNKTAPVSRERMDFTFHAPLASHAELAFKVLHDQDANNKVSKNWTGIWPAEGLGFSNGARLRAAGPPGFDDAKLSREQIMRGVRMHITYP